MSPFFVYIVFFVSVASSIFIYGEALSHQTVRKNPECGVANIIRLDREHVLLDAEKLYKAEIRTVTSDVSQRSKGGINDFYSEGDYWWPVEGDYDAPYVRRDGESNPKNFIAHRLSMMRLADIVAGLVEGYLLTDNDIVKKKYASRAEAHLLAWFVDPETSMNPNLLYSQAIKGRYSGRSIGLIDTLHLTEVALAANILIKRGAISDMSKASIELWFSEYSMWMNSHPFGVRERDHPNNHGVAWSLQNASFAKLTGNSELLELVREQFRAKYLYSMMASDGSFPKEISRTKPYGYSLFIIDLMAGIAQIASTDDQNLWLFETENGRSMRLGLDFIVQFVKDKSSWPYAKDLQYWDEWPMRHASLLFGGYQLDHCDFFGVVKDLPRDSQVYEVKRNFPIRNPILWLKWVD